MRLTNDDSEAPTRWHSHTPLPRFRQQTAYETPAQHHAAYLAEHDGGLVHVHHDHVHNAGDIMPTNVSNLTEYHKENQPKHVKNNGRGGTKGGW